MASQKYLRHVRHQTNNGVQALSRVPDCCD